MNNTRPQPDFGFFTAKLVENAPTDWKDVSPYDLQRNELAARKLANTYRTFEENGAVLFVERETRIHHGQLQQRVHCLDGVDYAWMVPVAGIETYSRPATDTEVLKTVAACIGRRPSAVKAVNKWLIELGLPPVML